MVTFMMESGKMIKLADMEHISITTEQDTKVNGLTTTSTEREQRLG